MALNRKIAYIDLTTGEVQTKPIPVEIRKKFIGRPRPGCIPALQQHQERV